MLMITIEIGRQNSGCTCKGYTMNVHDGHALAVCLPAKWRQVHGLYSGRLGQYLSYCYNLRQLLVLFQSTQSGLLVIMQATGLRIGGLKFTLNSIITLSNFHSTTAKLTAYVKQHDYMASQRPIRSVSLGRKSSYIESQDRSG